MGRYTLGQIAGELDVDEEDVFTVAEVELGDPELYDPESETVSGEGRRLLIEHFNGGIDPE
jgi:hypothetical protein